MEAAHSTTRANSVTTVAHPAEGDRPKDEGGDKAATPR
jgi:hypothetical protein